MISAHPRSVLSHEGFQAFADFVRLVNAFPLARGLLLAAWFSMGPFAMARLRQDYVIAKALACARLLGRLSFPQLGRLAGLRRVQKVIPRKAFVN